MLCTMSHFVFYFFYRWNIVREEIPQFQQRQQWYGRHVLKGEKNDKPLSYETQLDWTNKVFAGAKLSSMKKTHAGRSVGARMAELAGVGEGQIRRAGRWNTDALTNCYLTHLPRKFVRSMAGFGVTGQGDYYLPRAKITPPESLVRNVWPWVDEWLDWFNASGKLPGGDPTLTVKEEDRIEVDGGTRFG